MSLVTRVSAFFLIALGLALGGFSTALYFLAHAYMIRHLDEHIMLDLDALTAASEDGPKRVTTWDEKRPVVGLDPEVEEVFWAIYDEQGRPVDRSKNSGTEDFSQTKTMARAIRHAHASITSPSGQRWRLALRRVECAIPGSTPIAVNPVDPEEFGEDAAEHEEDGAMHFDRVSQGKAPSSWGHPALILIAGSSLEPLETTLRTLSATLAILSLALWGLAAAVGRFFCRRALVPMTRMAETARTMTTADRGQHLPSPETGDELEHLARSFNGLLDRLHETLEREKRFTGEASHQLRTPLTALIGAIDVARRRARTTEEYQEILHDVHEDAIHLRRIVEALMFLARAEAEAVRPNLQQIPLESWVEDHLIPWRAKPRGQDIRGPEPVDPPVWVHAHQVLLAQLLDNLLENACKYSLGGTPIHVTVGREAGQAILVVEDRGQGLAPSELPRVFEPFYRGEQGRRPGQPGIGLGLAIVQRIAAAFGGTVTVESEPGEGCRFTLHLPEVQPAAREMLV